MSTAEFIEITGYDPSQFKGVKRTWSHPLYGEREFTFNHTAKSLVNRVELNDPNLLEDGKLETKRKNANYIWQFFGNVITLEISFPSNPTKNVYVFERITETLTVSQGLTIEKVSGKPRLKSLTSINGQPPSQHPDASEVVRIGGGIEFSEDLQAPVLTHDAAARIGEGFTSDWTKDSDRYLPRHFAEPLILTLETTIKGGMLERYYKSYEYADGVLTEINETPLHHKAGNRLVVRSSHWQ